MKRIVFTRSHLSRREFLKAAGIAATACVACPRLEAPELANEPYEASFYEKLESGSVRCQLCPWQCVVPDGERGRCKVRENRGGKYYSLVYGRPCVTNNDPIEKKPFFHVYPGTKAFSIATVGCNIECKFCQNWDISQAKPEDVPAGRWLFAQFAGQTALAYLVTTAIYQLGCLLNFGMT